MFRLLQHIQRVDRVTHNLIAAIAGHIEEPLVNLDVTQVAQATDHRRRRIGIKGFFKALFGAGPLSGVTQDQYQQLGLPFGVSDRQAA
ncbi:hypothetical protein D3C75_946340 [compost metagenome]